MIPVACLDVSVRVKESFEATAKVWLIIIMPRLFLYGRRRQSRPPNPKGGYNVCRATVSPRLVISFFWLVGHCNPAPVRYIRFEHTFVFLTIWRQGFLSSNFCSIFQRSRKAVLLKITYRLLRVCNFLCGFRRPIPRRGTSRVIDIVGTFKTRIPVFALTVQERLV